MKDTINLLFLFSYYAMPFILKEMVQSMISTSFSGKEEIFALTINIHWQKTVYKKMLMELKSYFVITLAIVDDSMKYYNIRNFRCALKESF